jgi:hypothetical protein
VTSLAQAFINGLEKVPEEEGDQGFEVSEISPASLRWGQYRRNMGD